MSAATEANRLLAGQTALVTGASKNIGRAIALALAEQGADVAVTAGSNRSGMDSVVEEARGHGVDARGYLFDVGDSKACQDTCKAVTNDLGPISILVSNASVRPRQTIDEMTIDDWDRVIRTNLSATFYLAHAVLPGMVDSGFGRILAIGGPDGQRGKSHRAHNVTAKAGLIGMMKAITTEYASQGVTANVVVPGIMNTSRDPKNYPYWPYSKEEIAEKVYVGRMGEADEIANACVFLAGPASSYITGQTLHVSGGLYMP